MKYIVKEKDTILNFLYKNVNNSKNSIKSLLKNGFIFVNDKQIFKYDYEIMPKQIIAIKQKSVKDNNYELDILYEDNYIIVINKAYGLLSISTAKEKEKTAYHMVSDYLKSRNTNSKIFVVHRLDRETSGILMFAKDEKTKKNLQDNWDSLVKIRGYIALVEGHMKKQEGTIHTWLQESSIGLVYSSKNREGKEAITHYKVLKENDNNSLLDIKIDTGRKNQIRAHLKEQGNYIVGDKKYGSNIKGRLMLHAYILEFNHPNNNKLISIKLPIPKTFKNTK